MRRRVLLLVSAMAFAIVGPLAGSAAAQETATIAEVTRAVDAVWLFVAAGLYNHERRYIYIFLPLSLGLFIAGILFCFFLVFPFVLKFLLSFNSMLGVQPQIRLSEWISFAIILLAFVSGRYFPARDRLTTLLTPLILGVYLVHFIFVYILYIPLHNHHFLFSLATFVVSVVTIAIMRRTKLKIFV